MTVYSHPATITPNSASWSLQDNAATSVSFLSGFTQRRSYGGERWVVTLTYVNLQPAARAELSSLYTKLASGDNQIDLEKHGQTNRGSFGGTPLVNGAGQLGKSLVCDGAGTVTNWIREGDFFEVNNELKMATADANSSSGAVTLSFVPRLRSSPADNAAITTSSAKGRFYLVPGGVTWSEAPGGFSDLTVQLVEQIS